MQLHAQYYYQQLPPQERAAYHGMLTCLQALTPSARIPRLPMETLSTLFFQLRLDHPEIFYAVGFSCRAVPEAAFVEFWPEYRFEKKRIREHRQAIEARVTRLLRPLRSLPPVEQERAIHDFVVENVRYDKLEKPYSHEVIGPLTNGVGVCEGMAKTVKLLCDGLGLPCMIAVSDRDRANGERYLHAWNIVQLGGQCYHLDATFDNSLSKYGTRYDYFNLDDTKIFRDHRPLLYPAPPCTDGGQFFYNLQHLSWTKPVEAARRAAGPGDKGIADRLLPAAGPAARGFSADSESFGIQTVIDGLHVVPSCIGFPVDKPILLHDLSHRPDRAGPVPRSVCIDGLGRKKDPMG